MANREFREAPSAMKNLFLLVRLILFVVGLAAIVVLSLKLRDKWAQEAREAAKPPRATEAAG